MHKRPNLLFILTDQQRADTIAALGNSIIRTPNLDRLVREGVAFTRAYTPAPVCVPARCALHYSQDPARTGCFDNGNSMPTDRPSYADALTAAGYRTHAIGKCHFVPDLHALRGFQTRQWQEELVGDPLKDDYLRFLRDENFGHLTDPHGVRGEMYYIPQPAQLPARLHPTQWVSDQSCQFIREHATADRPWFLQTSFIHPHPPFCPPAPWHKLYRGKSMPLPFIPDAAEALTFFVNRHQNRYKYRDRGWDVNLIRQIKAYYYACISFIDFQIGRLLDSLESTGQLEHTLILFSSDHGEMLGDYGCFGKRSMHDASAQIPMLARWPDRAMQGTRCEKPVSLIDIGPTLLAAADAAPEPTFDGIDLARTARGESKRAQVFSQFRWGGDGLYAVMDERWKYIYSAPDDREIFFERAGHALPERAVESPPEDVKQRLKAALLAHVSHERCEAVDGNDWRRWPRRTMPTDPDAGLLIQDHAWANQHIPGYST